MDIDGRVCQKCDGYEWVDAPVVEKSGWEEDFYGLTKTMDGQYRPKLLLFIKNVEKEAGEKGYADGYADGIEIHKNIQEIARLEGKKEEEQEIKERLTKILKAATGNSGTIAVTPEVIMSNLFPEE